MKRLIVAVLAVLTVGTAPAASADGYCTSTVMNNGEDTYTFCRYSNPWRPSTTIVCLGNQHGRCTIEGN